MEKMVKTAQKKNGLLPGSTKQGFSFVEIVVAILIVGITLSVAMPALFKKGPKQQRHLFVQELNQLLEKASFQALTTGTIQKIGYAASTRTFSVAPQQASSDTADDSRQEGAKSVPTTKLAWPEELEIEQFYIQGVDEFSAKNSGKTTDEVWFYIIPDGMAQEIIINGRDLKDRVANGDQKPWSFVLNPFTLRFKAYEEYHSPSW